MNHYFQMVHHPYDTPTIKTKVLCLISNVKYLKYYAYLMATTALPSAFWAVIGDAFHLYVVPCRSIHVASKTRG